MDKNILKAIKYKLKATKGAILPMIVMIGAVVSMIGLAGLTVGVVLSRSNASIRSANKARVGAEAGVQDAMRRIIRNTQWAPTCISLASPTYNFILAGDVRVDVCASKSGSYYTVQSLGKARGLGRRIDAVISVDAVTGQVRLQSSSEVQL